MVLYIMVACLFAHAVSKYGPPEVFLGNHAHINQVGSDLNDNGGLLAM